jgi:hypothetical protein
VIESFQMGLVSQEDLKEVQIENRTQVALVTSRYEDEFVCKDSLELVKKKISDK